MGYPSKSRSVVERCLLMIATSKWKIGARNVVDTPN